MLASSGNICKPCRRPMESSRKLCVLFLSCYGILCISALRVQAYSSPPFMIADGDDAAQLQGRMLSFFGSDDQYSHVLEKPPQEGFESRVLTLGTSQAIEVPFKRGFRFPFFGALYDRMFVTSNGYITFGKQETSPDTTIATHFSTPRIAALATGLYVNTRLRQISLKQVTKQQMVVTYYNMRHLADSNTSLTNTVQIMLHCNGKIQMYFEKMLINQTFVVGLSNGIMPDVVEETPLTFIDESYKPQSRPSTMAVTMERQSVNTTGQSVNTIIARFSDEPDYQSTHQWQTQEAGVLTLEKLGHILEDTFILQQGISVNLVNALLSAGQIADDQLQMEAAKLLSKPDALDNGIMATLTNAAFDTSASEAHVLAAKLAFLEAAHDQERMTAATELVSLATFDDEDKAVAYRQLIASMLGSGEALLDNFLFFTCQLHIGADIAAGSVLETLGDRAIVAGLNNTAVAKIIQPLMQICSSVATPITPAAELGPEMNDPDLMKP